MKQKITNLLAFYVLGLTTYTLLRSLFLWSNHEAFQALGPQDIWLSFAHGVRFDLAILSLLNGIFILLYGLTAGNIWHHNAYRRSILAIMATTNCLAIFAQVADMEYFKFRGKRLTPDSLVVAQEFLNQITTTLQAYPQLWALACALSLAFVMLTNKALKPIPSRKAAPPPPNSWGKLRSAIGFVGLLAFVILSGRGGSQTKPLIPANGFTGTNPQSTHLTLNTPFSLLRSKKQERLKRFDYHPDWQALEAARNQLIPPPPPPPQQPTSANRPNFVVLILESFGREYQGSTQYPDGFTPFLNELAQNPRSLAFKTAYANGRRSIEALTAILGGLPNLMPQPLILSPYHTNTLRTMPRLLKQAGYRTWFFHGGYNGTMFFDAQAKLLGFEQYFGANEYPDPNDDDGHWGIFDGPFLQFTIDKLNAAEQPFLAGVFTLSSHYPYLLPASDSQGLPSGDLPIYRSVAYTDAALRQFFARAKQQPWYQNTVFFLTGDHTSSSQDLSYQTPAGQFRVPLMIFAPGANLTDPATASGNADQPAQHADIAATILALTGLSHLPQPRFGRSLIAPGPRHALLFAAQQYLLVTADHAIRGMPPNDFRAYDLRADPNLSQPIPETAATQHATDLLKTEIQYYNNGMLENRLNLPVD